MTPPPPPVWKDADEAAIKWKQKDPDSWIDMVKSSIDVAEDDRFCADYKVGFLKTTLQFLEAELRCRRDEGRW